MLGSNWSIDLSKSIADSGAPGKSMDSSCCGIGSKDCVHGTGGVRLDDCNKVPQGNTVYPLESLLDWPIPI